MNGIIIKKLQRAFRRLRSMTFLLKLAVFEGMKEEGRKEWN